MQHTLLALALAGAITATPITTTIKARQNLRGSTQNGLDGPCKDVTIIYARGTTEAGNVGAIAGPPFFQAVADAMGGAGNVAVQGVDYPADIPGFLAGGDRAGSAEMVSLVKQAESQCPNTAIIMSGYSQGGQLVHNAADSLGAGGMSGVAGAVIFGDPNNGDAVTGLSAAQTQVFCNRADNICAGGATILPAHLTYGNDAGDAAAAVQKMVAAAGGAAGGAGKGKKANAGGKGNGKDNAAAAGAAAGADAGAGGRGKRNA